MPVDIIHLPKIYLNSSASHCQLFPKLIKFVIVS